MLTRFAFFAALTTAGAGMLAPLLRDTNSAAMVRRGIENYEKKQHTAAVADFTKAASLKPAPISSFNTGTAHVAAGQVTEGAEMLTKAAADPALRADAFYNRGNAALSANAVDQAIEDYVTALKERPADRDAKRNLEIALLRRQSSQQSRPQQQSQPDSQQPDDPQQQEPRPGNTEGEQKQETDAESLLRSVEQQEREELSRMRRSRPNPRRVEW